MPENIIWNNSPVLEAEIAELSRQIEEKRRELETQSGIISDREVVAETIAESFNSEALEQTITMGQNGETSLPINISPTTATGTYLDTLDENSIATLNGLITMVSTDGIAKAISTAATHGPFMLDAFHDALVDKLYNELLARGLVK